MSTLYAACAVLGTFAALVAAASLLSMALALRATRRDARAYLMRISGQVAAAKELVRRATTDAVAGVPPDASPRWTSHLPRGYRT